MAPKTIWITFLALIGVLTGTSIGDVIINDPNDAFNSTHTSNAPTTNNTGPTIVTSESPAPEENTTAMLQEKESKVIYFSSTPPSDNAQTTSALVNETSLSKDNSTDSRTMFSTMSEEQSTMEKAYVESDAESKMLVMETGVEKSTTATTSTESNERKELCQTNTTTSKPNGDVSENNQTDAGNIATEDSNSLTTEIKNDERTRDHTTSVTSNTVEVKHDDSRVSPLNISETANASKSNKLRSTAKRDTRSKLSSSEGTGSESDPNNNTNTGEQKSSASSSNVSHNLKIIDSTTTLTNPLEERMFSSSMEAQSDEDFVDSTASDGTPGIIYLTSSSSFSNNPKVFSTTKIPGKPLTHSNTLDISKDSVHPTSHLVYSTFPSATNDDIYKNSELESTTINMPSEKILKTSSEQSVPQIKPATHSTEQRSSALNLDHEYSHISSKPQSSTISLAEDLNTLSKDEPLTDEIVTEFYDTSDDITSHRTIADIDEAVVTERNKQALESSPLILEDTTYSAVAEEQKIPLASGNVMVPDMHESASSIIFVATDGGRRQISENRKIDNSTVRIDVTSFENIDDHSNVKLAPVILVDNKIVANENFQGKDKAQTSVDAESVVTSDAKVVVETKLTSLSQNPSTTDTLKLFEKPEVKSMPSHLMATASSEALEDRMVNDAQPPTLPNNTKLSILKNKLQKDHDVKPNNAQLLKGDNNESHPLVAIPLREVSDGGTTAETANESLIHSNVSPPIKSAEEVVTLISTRVIISTQQIRTPSVQETKLTHHIKGKEYSLQAQTSVSKHLDNASVAKKVYEENTDSSSSMDNATGQQLSESRDQSTAVVGLGATESPELHNAKFISFNHSDISPAADQSDRLNDSGSNETTAGDPEPTTLSVSLETTTTPPAIRIRKPKIRFTGDTDAIRAPITRSPPNKRPPPEQSGTPVSIFRKSRSRRPSITSSTTAASVGQYKYRGMYNTNKPLRIVGTEMIEFSLPPTTPVPTTTEAEEEEEEEEEEEDVIIKETISVNQPLFEDENTLIKIAGELIIEKGLRWKESLNNRNSPEFKKQSERMLRTLNDIFEDTPLTSSLHSIEIDGFVRKSKSSRRNVIVDYSIFMRKTDEPVDGPLILSVFTEKVVNNTYGRYLFEPFSIKIVSVEPVVLHRPTETPDVEPPIPQWAIAVIVIGAASFIFVVLFAAVTAYGRHHMRRRYANKLNDDDIERSDDSRDWENKLGTAYENLAADGIYDVDDSSSVENVKRSYLVD